jgi:hypothetical protein
VADDVEAFVAALKHAEPAVTRVGAGAAHQQREPLAAAPFGGGEVGGVELGLAHQRRGHRLHGRFKQVEKMFLQAGVDVARGHVVNDGVLESVTHGQCFVVGTDVMNALFQMEAKRIRDETIISPRFPTFWNVVAEGGRLWILSGYQAGFQRWGSRSERSAALAEGMRVSTSLR